MRIVELNHETDLDALRGPWDSLLQRAAKSNVFVTWEWLASWWASYGASGGLKLLTAWNDDNELTGIVPLRSQKARRFGQTVSTLSFLGDGSNDSDYLDFILATGSETQIVSRVLAHLNPELAKGTVLVLNELPGTSAAIPALEQMALQSGILHSTRTVPCSTVALPNTWEEYLGMLRPRFRTKVRSVLRGVESRPDVRFRFCETAAEVDNLLPVLFDLHTRRWQQEGKPGVFGWDRKRAFYRTLSKALLEQGWLRFSWLEWNGKILAAQYGFTYKGVYSQLQEGYEPASEHWNCGIALRAWTIRHFIGAGVREYDFLGGVGRHKSDWGSVIKEGKSFLIARKTLANVLFCQGPQFVEQGRESLKGMLPAAVISLGRRLRSRSSQLREGRPQRLDRLAASCYLNLHVPTIMRPIRERYQLAVPASEARRLPWMRRDRPSARILYYHRVNDDQDPFFPSIPTRVFQRHMQFVAKHYRVVGLDELPDRLEDNSRDPLIAITFDDGYRDNYQNAFPILASYGLPATIFLTTGSIDSGEPLWFERLATALKHSNRDYFDLEIDIPRRFWLRTPAERLDANARVFGLLRALPDPARRDWLVTILRDLNTDSNSERRNKMLSWDQIRTMDLANIRFGGHTVNHPFLSKLESESLNWEIGECKRRIEEELQHPVRHFSYPNGREEDFDARNKETIRLAGYRGAVTTIWGMNYADTDPMELRRGGPWEQDLAQFAYKLDWYQLVND